MKDSVRTPKTYNSSSDTERPSLLVVIDAVRTRSPDHFGCLSGWQWDSLKRKLQRAGFQEKDYKITLLSSLHKVDLSPIRLIIGLGEKCLQAFTDKKSVDKWHLSPFVLDSGRTFLSSFDLARVQKQYELNLFQEMTFQRAREFLFTPYAKPVERFLLNPSLEETLEVLERIKDEEEIACDVETGYGQINTVGFAWSPHDAIAINVLPDRLADKNFFLLWNSIQRVLGGRSRKIFQNFLYDVSYFSAYGIQTENIWHDTMFAQKVLYPELKSNLGNVGRIFTKRPYWKDDGKVSDEESTKKDWGNVRDWKRHYIYNCRDTTGTFEAAGNQRQALRDRALFDFYELYVRQLIDPIQEMCARGMPVDSGIRDRLREEARKKIGELEAEFARKAGREINLSSPKQVQEWLKEKKVKLPKKFNKEKGIYKETTDAASIKKIALKYPELTELKLLQEYKTTKKALSSYIDFRLRPDGRLPYSINACGTETLRFSGGKDPWDRGFNIQTIPREGGGISVKQMFVAPAGLSFLEVDLSAAESRYVAYASGDKKLIEMLEDGADVHSHVAHSILKALGKPSSEYSKQWRNLAKKTGHGANYLMKAGTFIENVFKDMDIVLPKKEAELILESYRQEFPKIPEWQGWVKNELYTKRNLTAPSGWHRYFYGRPDDNMWREGVAWAPQHTIPWITNHMMFHLLERRKEKKLDFQLIAQVHDSLILLVPDGRLEDVVKSCNKIKDWHPEIELLGGKLWIPIEAESGKNLADKTAVEVN